MRAEFRALAEERGLDPRIAEAMVDEEIEIPGLEPQGQAADADARRGAQGGLRQGRGGRRGRAARRRSGCPAAQVVATEPNWAEQVVRFLTNPLVSPLLLSLGVLGLVFEIKTGAFGLGGLVEPGVARALLRLAASCSGSPDGRKCCSWASASIALAVEVFVLPGIRRGRRPRTRRDRRRHACWR